MRTYYRIISREFIIDNNNTANFIHKQTEYMDFSFNSLRHQLPAIIKKYKNQLSNPKIDQMRYFTYIEGNAEFSEIHKIVYELEMQRAGLRRYKNKRLTIQKTPKIRNPEFWNARKEKFKKLELIFKP